MNLDFLRDFVSPLISGIVAAVLVPRIQHGLWKRQRFREQQLSTAREWAEFVYAVEQTILISYKGAEHNNEHILDILVRQNGLLAVIPVLFHNEDTNAARSTLISALDNLGDEKWWKKHQRTLGPLRYKLLSQRD